MTEEEDWNKGKNERIWERLMSLDSGKAYDALCELGRAPSKTLGEVGTRVKMVRIIGRDECVTLLKGLNDREYGVRERAFRTLEENCESVEEELRKRLGGELPPEVRRRIELVLEGLDKGTFRESIRRLRVIEALEYAGSAEARKVLDLLALGEPGTRTTVAAREASERLARASGESLQGRWTGWGK